jgi:hypothetical protein
MGAILVAQSFNLIKELKMNLIKLLACRAKTMLHVTDTNNEEFLFHWLPLTVKIEMLASKAQVALNIHYENLKQIEKLDSDTILQSQRLFLDLQEMACSIIAEISVNEDERDALVSIQQAEVVTHD